MGNPLFGRPFVNRFALCYRSVVCLSVCLSVWPNGWTDQDETWRAGRPHPWPHCVRWGPSSPSRKGGPSPPIGGGAPPIFGPYLLWRNGWMDQDATWYGGTPRPRRLCVRRGPRSPSQKGGGAPQIFGPYLLWPNGWMDQDDTWHGGRPHPRRIC